MITPTELAEAIGKMEAEILFGFVVLILFSASLGIALVLWIFDNTCNKVERAISAPILVEMFNGPVTLPVRPKP